MPKQRAEKTPSQKKEEAIRFLQRGGRNISPFGKRYIDEQDDGGEPEYNKQQGKSSPHIRAAQAADPKGANNGQTDTAKAWFKGARAAASRANEAEETENRQCRQGDNLSTFTHPP